jgi:hypothetical protein
MITKTGNSPPLHRRYSESEAIEQVRNRYVTAKSCIVAQVRELQTFEPFKEKCAKLYEEGFKDWIILTIIFNCMMNWLAQERGQIFTPEIIRDKFPQIKESMRGKVFPGSKFMSWEFELNMNAHMVTVLSTWGFEIRRHNLSPKVVSEFLRRRMRHFDHDLPHRNLFGEPPGDWPDLSTKGRHK